MSEKLKVLVVDDDRRMVKTICDILHLKGYEALPAYSGEEAMNKLKDEGPDCVLMDLRMPGMNGVETLKMIRDLSPDTPVVLMSAYASNEQTEEARLNGAATIFTKPVDFQQILSFLALLKDEKNIPMAENNQFDSGEI